MKKKKSPSLKNHRIPGRSIAPLLRKKFVLPRDVGRASPLEALTHVSRSLETLIMSDHEIAAFVEEHVARPFYPETTLEEVLKYLALRIGRMPKTDPGLTHAFLNTLVQPRMHIEREAQKTVLEELQELSTTERAILNTGFDLAGLFDAFFLDWYLATVLPSRKTLLSEKGPKDREEIVGRFRELGLDNPYTLVVAANGFPPEEGYDLKKADGYTQRSLAEVFPRTLNEIADKLDELRQLMAPEAAHFHEYFAHLRDAILCRVPERLEEKWKAVDEAWIRIPSSERVIPVHMMESGYGDPIRVSPEFRIMWRLAEGAEEISVLRRSMGRLAEEIGSRDIKNRLDRIDIGLFVTLVDSGSGLDFRITGQAVPNRPEVRAEGMKIFLDDHSLALGAERARKLLEASAAPPTLKWALPELTKNNYFLAVAGHELAHPVGVSKELEEASGSQKPLEELKATLLGMQAVMGTAESDQEREEIARAMAAMALTRIVRMLEGTSFNNPTLKPYVIEAAGMLCALKFSGRLHIEQDKILLEPKEGFTDVMKPLLDLCELILKGYVSLDVQALAALQSEYADLEHPDVEALRSVMDKALSMVNQLWNRNE